MTLFFVANGFWEYFFEMQQGRVFGQLGQYYVKTSIEQKYRNDDQQAKRKNDKQ